MVGILISVPLLAQFSQITPNTTVPWPAPGHDYLKLLQETVTPADGQVSVRINFPISAGRQLTLPFGYAYDSNGVYYPTWLPTGNTIDLQNWGQYPIVGSIQWVSGGSASTPNGGGWTHTLPWSGGPVTMQTASNVSGGQPCVSYVNWSFFDSEGGRHLLKGLTTAPSTNDPSCAIQTYQVGGDYYYTGIVPAGSASPYQGLVVNGRDGTTYDFTGTTSGLSTKIEDRNGNYLTLSGSSSGIRVTDTLNNPVLTLSGLGTNTNLAALSSGMSYTIQWQANSYNFNPNAQQIGTNSGCVFGSAIGSNSAIQSITLPNNTQYTFTYDSTTGQLASIKYPSGALVSYVWGRNVQTATSHFNDANGDLDACVFRYDMPAITKRTVYFDGVTPALEQDFVYTTAWNPNNSMQWTSKTTTVTNNDLIRGTHSVTTYSYGPGVDEVQSPPGYVIPDGYANIIPLENTIITNDWSGNQIQKVTKQWIDAQQIQNEQVTNPAGTRSTTYYYNQVSAAVSEIDESDYSGNLLRKSHRTYIVNSTSSGPSYVPCEDTVSDGNGKRSETDYYYDSDTSTAPCQSQGRPSVLSVGAVQHDETNYGTNSTRFRANLTKKVQWASAGNSPVTTYAYDETGQLISAFDPNGYRTSYSYADNPPGENKNGASNAYLTQITDPLGYSEQFAYDYATGEMSNSVDQNSKTTSYKYNDNLNRLTETDYPDGGKTTISYDDSVPSITTSTLMNTSNQLETSVAIMDRMGQVIETQLTSDPSGTDFVNTTYDGENHVFTQSNPHRGASSSTDGTTQHFYDALGRPIKEIEQDGGVLQWCYNGVASSPAVSNCGSHRGSVMGTWVDSTDAVGNHWQRTSDALGRLVEVMEPSGTSQTPTFETDYAYDALNNLWSANQRGNGSTDMPRVRSFSYNSLSQLLSATNPETGTVSYTYDLNGNVQTKTDARGVKTSYAYNALNLPLSKTYSNDASGTPTSCYQYGTSATENTIERLVNAWTQSASAGACATAAPTSGFWTKRSILVYDAMGRILNEQQYTPANQAIGTPYAPAYTYYLEGNLHTSTSGVGPTFTDTYDGAGRLQTVTSNLSDSKHPSTLFSAQAPPGTPPCTNASSTPYAAFGGLLNATFGNGLTLNRSYDNRLQTTCEIDTGSIVATPTSGSATVTITGSEQSK